MRKLRILALLGVQLLLLTACHAGETYDRAAAVRERYAAAEAYSAAAEVILYDEEEILRYTLRFDAGEEAVKITVLAPELLAGITAHLTDDTLALEYDALVLDAGGAVNGVNAVSCVPLVLRAVADGWLLAQSEEEIEHGGERIRALRLCMETETDDETLCCTVWFGAGDAPLRARIEENEKITADIEFTSFAFCDTIPSDGDSSAE